jgi:hypothetical protein
MSFVRGRSACVDNLHSFSFNLHTQQSIFDPDVTISSSDTNGVGSVFFGTKPNVAFWSRASTTADGYATKSNRPFNSHVVIRDWGPYWSFHLSERWVFVIGRPPEILIPKSALLTVSVMGLVMRPCTVPGFEQWMLLPQQQERPIRMAPAW